MLTEATGVRWTIALSGAAGEPTLAEQGAFADAARRVAAAEHPMVRAILEAFPGARIEAVHDSRADALGLSPEPVLGGEPEFEAPVDNGSPEDAQDDLET
jgi:DNA polymerase-3 subunit gamma/tau